MAKHGHLGEFDANKDDWKSYIERAKQSFAANDIADAVKRRAILLSACGASTYRTIKDVLTPQAPGEVAFDDIVEMLSKYFQPTPSEIVQRCRFNSRIRRPHETIAVFTAQLKKLVEHCNFGDTLNQMLRDRLVCGVNNEKWQQRVLAEEGLTYDKALKMLLALEAAEREVKDLSGPKEVLSVRSRRPQTSPPFSKQTAPPQRMDAGAACYRCGGRHDQAECWYREEECHFCHKKGHIAAVCRQKKKQPPQHSQQRRTPPRKFVRKSTHRVVEEPEPVPPEYPMYSCSSPGTQPLFVEVQIHEAPIRMEVDTGATLSIISRHTYDTTWEEAPSRFLVQSCAPTQGKKLPSMEQLMSK